MKNGLLNRKEILTKEMIIAFKSSIFVGIITYLTMLILQPVVADPVLFLFRWKDVEWQLINQGRWAGNIYKFFFGYLVIPTLNILFKIFSMSCVACIFIDLFNVKNKWNIILISAAIVSHPTVANHLMYYSTTNDFAFVLIAVSIWLCSNIDSDALIWKIIVSGILESIALGMGQSYISFISSFVLLYFLFCLLTKKNNGYKIFAYNLGAAIVGCILYFIIWKLEIHFSGVSIFYGGTENYGLSNTVSSFAKIIKSIYSDFFNFYFNDSIIHNAYWHRGFLNSIMLIISLCVIIVYVFIEKRKEYSLSIKSLILFSILVIPIALQSVSLIVTDYKFYLVMAEGYILVVPFILAVFDNLVLLKILNKCRFLIYIICLIITWTHVLSDNAGAIYENQTFLRTKSSAERILSRIEQQEEYCKDNYVPICFIGQPLENNNYLNELFKACPGSTFSQTGVFSGLWENSDGWGRYIEYYCGVHLNYYTNGTQGKIREIKETEKFINAPCFPAQGCIYYDGDTLVVKLGN